MFSTETRANTSPQQRTNPEAALKSSPVNPRQDSCNEKLWESPWAQISGGKTIKKLTDKFQKWKVTGKILRKNATNPKKEAQRCFTNPSVQSLVWLSCQDPPAPLGSEISKRLPEFQTHFPACAPNCCSHLQKEVKHSENKWHVQGHTQSQLQSQQKSKESFAENPLALTARQWLPLPRNQPVMERHKCIFEGLNMFTWE